jgi:multiple sugar transport system permease protein
MAASTSVPRRGLPFNLDKHQAEALSGYFFLAPAMLVFLVFLIIPIGFALFISLTDWNGITPVAQTEKSAAGTATFTNLTGDAVTIPAGTIISNGGDTPKAYRTIEDTVVPAGKDSSIDAAIEAVTPGSDSNVRKEQLDTVPEALAGVVDVTNAAAISNGLDTAYHMVGLENYGNLLLKEGTRQKDFFTALKNTLYFVLGVVPTQTLLALLLAVVVNQRWLRAKGLFRTAFYFPSITSSVVISIIFMWMFTQSGLVNTILGLLFPNYESVTWLDDSNGLFHNFLGLFGVTRTTVGDWAGTRLAGLTLWEWISGPSVTMFTIMILNTWTTIGTLMIIYLAALQNIPSSVYEAAAIDGATGWQAFRFVTVPLLVPTTFFVVTLGLIGTFQVFDQVFVISSGGPAKTTLTIAYIVYSNGFNNSEMGLAAATALILFVIIFTFTMIQRRITRETVNA